MNLWQLFLILGGVWQSKMKFEYQMEIHTFSCTKQSFVMSNKKHHVKILSSHPKGGREQANESKARLI